MQLYFTFGKHSRGQAAWLLTLGFLIAPGNALAELGVQVGAFSDPRNATHLVEKLRDSGFIDAVSMSKLAKGRALHAVLIGPFNTRGAAERARQRLIVNGWSGYITPYPAVPAADTRTKQPANGAIGALSASEPLLLPGPTDRTRESDADRAADSPRKAEAVVADDIPDAVPAPASTATTRLTGYIAGEFRWFPQDPLSAEQHGNYLALSLRPEFYRAWNDARDSVIFTPFVRADQHDEERTHADINELLWQHVARVWEIRAGIGKVFWGVTESQHLVDIINQTDLVESIDLEEKLGQPLVNLTLIRDWGNLNLFVLPGFRERTFPGPEGRLRTMPRVDTDQARYESGAKDKHVDLAVRWSKIVGDWDIALAHFSGTGRDPLLLPGLDSAGNPALIPFYEQIDQSSLDLQAALDAWLWKLEAISRHGANGRYTALTGGLEYTIVGVLDTPADLGIITEYLFDDRGKNAATPFDNDVMIGTRLTFNDMQSSELLVGAIIDAEGEGVLYNLEASRRLGDRWKLGVEARLFSNISANSVLSSQRNDDYLQLDLSRYF